MYLCRMKTHTVNGKEKLEEIMKKGKEDGLIHISFSEFKLFTECAHRHLVEKHLKLVEQEPSIHLYFGSAVHEAIEHGVEEGFGPERRAKYFRDMFIKDMINNIPDYDAHAKETDKLEFFIEQGENILKTLDVEGIIEKYEIISVEEPLYESVFDRFYFKGFVDLVVKDRETGRYIIIDWKTSGQKWNMFWKEKDWAFMMQMRFYKYFWCRKNGVELDDVDCRYIVLNRLKDKKKPEGGFGDVEEVDIPSSQIQIKQAVNALGRSLKSIYKDKRFRKAKFTLNKDGSVKLDSRGQAVLDEKPCRFCPLVGGKHSLCNSNFHQDKLILKENNRVF
jgi:hypothetical protein